MIYFHSQVAQLEGLVQRQVDAMKQYWAAHYNVAIKERIDWPLISQELGRVPRDCLEKYKEVQRRRHKAQAPSGASAVVVDASVEP